MTRLNNVDVLRRTSERLTAGAAAIAATFLMLATVEVRAAEAEATTARITVTYNDTAFATQAETAAVYRKLKAAAREVCGVEIGTRVTLNEHARAKACVDQALTDVVRRLNRPMLTSVHEALAGKVG